MSDLEDRTKLSLKQQREKYNRDLAALREQNEQLEIRLQELSNPKKDEGQGQADGPKPAVAKPPVPKTPAQDSRPQDSCAQVRLGPGA